MKTSRQNLNPILVFTVIFILILASTATIFALQSSLSMVTQLSGTISYFDAIKNKETKLVPFMKLYEGDKLTLDKGSSLQLVLFENGSKETWQGPAVLILDKKKGIIAQNSKNQPTISSLSEVVTNEVRRISKIIDTSRMQKAGVRIVRGQSSSEKDKEMLPPVELDSSEEKEVNIARSTYQSLLKGIDKTDITPELFLFSVLADYDQYIEMAQLIEIMKKKQPDNPTIGQLTTWMEEQM